MVNSPGRAAGQMADTVRARCFRANKASGITITLGDLCHVDIGTSPDSWRTTPASASVQGPFAISYYKTVAAAAAETKVSLADNGIFYVNVTGTAEPGDRMVPSATVAGSAMAITDANLTATPAKLTEYVGLCLGNGDTWDTGSPTAVTDGVAAVYIRTGGL